jgi:hypothetical protein
MNKCSLNDAKYSPNGFKCSLNDAKCSLNDAKFSLNDANCSLRPYRACASSRTVSQISPPLRNPVHEQPTLVDTVVWSYLVAWLLAQMLSC